jgi:hypothetical protein
MRFVARVTAYSTGLVLLSFMFWFIGYQQGALNQVYFDAPAKIQFFSVAEEDLEERVAAVIFRQRCILGKSDRTSALSVYHPIHNDVRRQFHALIDRVCVDETCGCELTMDAAE